MRFVLYEYAVDTVTALNAAMASIVAANYAAVNVLFVDVGLGYLRQIWGTMTRRHDNNMMKGGGVGGLQERWVPHGGRTLLFPSLDKRLVTEIQ